MDPKIYSNLEEISGPFKGILLDAYGVFWGGGGVGQLPGSREAMKRLVAAGKIVGVLSNATRLVYDEIEKLKAHGFFQGEHFHFFITSGELMKELFSRGEFPFSVSTKKFYLFGEQNSKLAFHRAIFNNTFYEETDNLLEADFIYISVPQIGGEDQTDREVFRKQVESLLHAKIPMVCGNPDLFAHEGNPPRMVVRQGSIAALYEELGGEVFYIGKPSTKMYFAAMEKFTQYQITNTKDVIMVGDTPETDIRGAKRSGIASALVVKTGIMAERIGHHGWEEALKILSSDDIPEFFIQQMGEI